MANDNNYALPAGTVLQGRVYTYTIEKVLGQGAFGITYLASTIMAGPLGEVQVQVALKEFFSKELDSRQSDGTVSARTEDGVANRYARAFQRESGNLSRMKHPGIVNVLEAFEAKGTYYYSMEYLSGGSLDDKVKNVGMPEAEALAAIAKIGKALSYMHEQKMMHLDLKPKNIMLKANGSPVVIDFGLSKQYDGKGEPESSSTIGLGTPGYAPIEQANLTSGKSFQPTLDVYALGATLYKMLTGSTPPVASSILEDGLPESPLKAKGVSENTIAALRASMRPSRKDRPQSVDAFLSMLDDYSSSNNTIDREECPSVSDHADADETKFVERRDDSPRQTSPTRDYSKRFSIITVLYLLMGAMVGGLIIFDAVYVLGHLIKYGGTSIGPFLYSLMGLVAVVAEIGIVFLFKKRKPGFWILVIAIAICCPYCLWYFGVNRQFAGLLFITIAVIACTYGILQIKNEDGISGWELLTSNLNTNRPK